MDRPYHPPETELIELAPGIYEGRLRLNAGEVACDFCAATRDVTTEFPCRDFKIADVVVVLEDGRCEGQEHWNRGSFLACGACARLIDGGQYALLLMRMINRWRAQHGGEPDADPFITMIAGFAKHRLGPGRTYPPARGDAAR